METKQLMLGLMVVSFFSVDASQMRRNTWLIAQERSEDGFTPRHMFPHIINGTILRQEGLPDRILFSNPDNGIEYIAALENILFSHPIKEPGGYTLDYLLKNLQADNPLIHFYNIKKNGDTVSFRYHSGKIFHDNRGNIGKLLVSDNV